MRCGVRSADISGPAFTCNGGSSKDGSVNEEGGGIAGGNPGEGI